MRRRVAALVCLLSWLPAAALALTAAEEQQLGRQFELRSRSTLPLVDDVEVNAYITRLGERIVATLKDQPFRYRFFVINDARINAFAVPGGAIYVNSGLLMTAASDDEVAGVLAHEVAHVHNHHLGRQQDATKALNYATLLGVLLTVVQPAVGAGAAAIGAATQLQYRREFEQEADFAGARYTHAAGFAPGAMLSFFRKMMAQQGRSGAAQTPYLLTHPLTEVRLDHLEATLRAQKWEGIAATPGGLNLANVQVLVRSRAEPAQTVVADYRRQAEAQPSNPTASYLLGRAYFEAGMFDSALASLETARAAGLGVAEAERGRTLLRLRQFEAARTALKNAVEAEPDDAVAHADLAKVLSILGDDAGARREYESAVKIAPRFEAAHYELGQLAGRAGHVADGYYHLGVALLLRGDLRSAANQFDKTLPLLDANDPRVAEVKATLTDLAPLIDRPVPTP